MPARPHRAETEALIVGGGPAGAALGTLLARRGRSVEILEQSPAPHHAVCGEFLSWEAARYLQRLGVDLDSLRAVPIHGVRLSARSLVAQCELPFPALSLTRRSLDEALLALAEQAGAVVQRGRRVESLQRCGPGWSAHLVGGETRRAQTAFLATGKQDLAGHRRPHGRQNTLVAFKMLLRLDPAQQSALRGWVDVLLFPGGYAGLLLTEDGDANLCLLVNRKTLHACHNDWPTLLERMSAFCAPLAQRLRGARPLLSKPLALSAIPFGLLLSHAEPGLWRLGDQAAVIPSFTGDGISIALHSAQVAAELYLQGGTSAQLAQRLHRELRAPVSLATALARLVIAAPPLVHAARIWPRLLCHLAAHTRVPGSAMLLGPTPRHPAPPA